MVIIGKLSLNFKLRKVIKVKIYKNRIYVYIMGEGNMVFVKESMYELYQIFIEK